MRLKYVLVPVIAFLMVCGINSCSKNSGGYGGSGGSNTGGNPYGNPPPQNNPPAASISLKSDAHFGSVLADGNGKTLYFFSLDANGSSACTSAGGCLAEWPKVYIASPTLGAGLKASDFKTITRSDGGLQTTYKGWPLYTFSGDATAADIKGDGFQGIWYVAKPDYTVMMVSNQLVGDNGTLYDSTYKPGTGNTFYMTDDQGITLYSFTADKAGTNNYTLSDFSNDSFFPIVQLNSIQSVPSILDKSLFSIITVFGKKQLTYKGWPVYRFGPDSMQRGNTKGISVPSPGIWPVMNQFSPAAPQ
jgi:predicted lipoprotein with Yx(FWY)xxD motif